MQFISFLQSAEWEAFQQTVGYETFRIDGALLIKKKLPFNRSYLYCPPITIGGNQNSNQKDIGYWILDINKFLAEVRELARRERAIFLRIEPLNQVISNIQYPISKVADVQPSKTIILDLVKSEDELLAGMHSKTRYNIRLAEKKGVTVRPGNEKDFEAFWDLMQETTNRDEFRSHSKHYYRHMLANPIMKLYVAQFQGQVIASGIFIFYGDTATYLHGASTHRYKEIMAPYALQWSVIKLAKQEGYQYYDFYGIDEAKWPGVTRFKRGFSRREVTYPGTYDVIFNQAWYSAYQWLRKVRNRL